MRRGPPGGGTWTGVVITLAGIALGLAIAAAIPPLREAVLDALRGDTDQVREDLRDLGAWGVVLVAALAIVHAVVFFPAEILNAAAGFVYGFGPGLPLVWASWTASAMLAYEIGRQAARPLLYRLLGRERFEEAERLVHRGGITFLLAARLVPVVPISLMSYVCGAARIGRWPFLWTTAVGLGPITAYFVYLGSRLREFSFSDPVVWIGGAALLLALLGIRYLRPQPAPRSGLGE